MNQQTEIANWFNETYQTKGFKYLRAVDAYEIFVNLLNPKPGSNHLDVACGLGLMLKAMSKREVNLYGIDISNEAIDNCKKYCPEAQVQQGNAENLPYESDFFDSITCIGSIERMLDRPKVLKEQFRVAKSGAKICYMVRNAENFTWKYLQQPFNLYNKKGHQDALNKAKWEDLFLKSGFEIKSVHPDHWPYVKTVKTLWPWSRIDAGKIRKFPFSLELAYEFIYLLEKP